MRGKQLGVECKQRINCKKGDDSFLNGASVVAAQKKQSITFYCTVLL